MTNMHGRRVEKLKQEYTGQTVTIDSDRTEFIRFRGVLGHVRTVNFNGCALVEFEGADRTWHDIELDYVKVIDEPAADELEPPTSDQAAKPSTPTQPEPTDGTKPTQKLSRLELARLQKSGVEK